MCNALHGATLMASSHNLSVANYYDSTRHVNVFTVNTEYFVKELTRNQEE